jgi:ketosteroid isomerase-like protein
MWEDRGFEPLHAVDGGDRVVGHCRQWGRVKDSGIELEWPSAMTWVIRGGRGMRREFYDRWADARAGGRASLGVRCERLGRTAPASLPLGRA